MLEWSPWNPSEEMDRADDEDPDIIQGIYPEWNEDLGMTSRRDPDCTSSLERVPVCDACNLRGGHRPGERERALRAQGWVAYGASAAFAYRERFVWGIFMGQLTLARFRGDTTFGLVARIISTFMGGLVGTAMWYISTGSGNGNPYGLAAVIGVCAPFFFFGRLYWPIPPMTNIIFFVTAALVRDLGSGFLMAEYAYHAAIQVHGVAAGLATVRSGRMRSNCGVLVLVPPSFDNAEEVPAQDDGHDGLRAGRGVLFHRLVREHPRASRGRKGGDRAEPGRYPPEAQAFAGSEDEHHIRVLAERTMAVEQISEDPGSTIIAYLLSHLMSVVEHLEPAWSRASSAERASWTLTSRETSSPS
ncbi:hypothetical protein NUW54_g13121 [Trametes sanguinea]|uniref:Uncharacterized protein n=1 Tax=Trametes sanguinea TaxID=158606 RepID=A0ACC1MR01_9APHY|nr:hypothetical protein NUW54_g13121 [Trametes sanguinea]